MPIFPAYSSGVSDKPCELTEEMRAIMRENSLALEQMLTMRSRDSRSPGQSAG